MIRSSHRVAELDASPVAETVAELGESPLWDSERGLRWLDVTGRRLFTLDPEGGQSSVGLSQTVTAIELCPGHLLLAVTSTGFGTLDPATGQVDEIVCVLNDHSLSMNDSAIDARGRCWAGASVRDQSRKAALYRLDASEITTQLTGLGMSNGLDWSPEDDVLYHVDTAAGTVTAWDFDLAAGELGSGRLVRSIPAEVGLPDGLTVDTDGDIWLAVWGLGQVWRLDPRSGETTGIVHVPTRYPTSCVFGGTNLSTLYITTAAYQNAAGGGLLYAADVPARGRSPHRFGGGLR